jgi:hypothetical protein
MACQNQKKKRKEYEWRNAHAEESCRKRVKAKMSEKQKQRTTGGEETMHTEMQTFASRSNLFVRRIRYSLCEKDKRSGTFKRKLRVGCSSKSCR